MKIYTFKETIKVQVLFSYCSCIVQEILAKAKYWIRTQHRQILTNKGLCHRLSNYR